MHGFTDNQAQSAIAELGAGIAVAGDIRTDAGAEMLIDSCLEHYVDIFVKNYGTADDGDWLKSEATAPVLG